MDEGRFRVLMHMLRTMDASRKESPSLESAIIRIIESFRKALTPKQQSEVQENFERYENKRRGMEKTEKLHAIMDTEKYRELVHREPISEETDWGLY